MPHNWDETWRWLLALGGIIGIYRLAVFLNDRARGAKSRARHPTTWRHWFMLPLTPFWPFIWGGSLALWLISVLVSWALRKAWPLIPVREPPALASDDRVRRKATGPTRYPLWACMRGQTGWVHVAVEITPDGAYRAHRIVDASPPAVFDRAVAHALTGTTYEAVDGASLPADFETLYRFVPPERPKPRRAAPVAAPAIT
ncbi:energy transducer TonB [Caulobacter sp.]|uniref:energy transducer TonB n=1 Tax=Caulobacter sp. TaxID=78 RepID=UPI003BAFEDC4